MLNLVIALFIVISPMFVSASDDDNDPADQPEFDKLWNYNNPAETEQVFSDIYEKYKADASESYLAQLLSQIARTQGLQGNFEQGFATIKQAKAISPELDDLSKVRILLETGRLYNSSGNPETAKEYFIEAKETAEKAGLDLYAIDAVHMLGIVDPPGKQLEWNLLAIKMIEESSDKKAKGWLGPLLNNTGWTYFDMGNYQEAMVLFKKSLKWREEIKDDSGIRIAKWTIARNLRAMQDYNKALDMQLKLEKEIIEKKLPEDAYVFEELGELYLITNDPEKAKFYFKKAYPLLASDPWLQKNEAERLNRIKELME